MFGYKMALSPYPSLRDALPGIRSGDIPRIMLVAHRTVSAPIGGKDQSCGVVGDEV